LARRIVAAPRLGAPQSARKRVAAWLSELASTASAQTLRSSPRKRGPRRSTTTIEESLDSRLRGNERGVGETLAAIFSAAPPVEALIAGIAEGSPFLWELIRAEPARLLTLLQSDP